MKNIIESLVSGKLESFRSQIHNSLYEKVAKALEEKKAEIAQNLYCTECNEAEGENTLEEGKMPPQLAAALAKKKGKKKGAKKSTKGKKPDFLDLDKDGNKKEPMKKAANDAKKGKK